MAQGATRKSRRMPLRGGALWLARRTGLLLVLGLVAGIAVLAARELSGLPVERVIVNGDMQRVSREQMQAMVSGALGGGFLGVDLQAVRAPLEQHPWVFRAVVKRRWPNSLEIEVLEQRPIARWGERALLNHEGEVFRPQQLPQLPHLPLLTGPDGSQLRLMRRYMEMQELLAGAGLQVEALHMDRLGGLRAQLGGNVELVLGRSAFREKMARFLGVYALDLARQRERLARVDLRYQHGLAVAWKPGVVAQLADSGH